jgi:Fe-Mn family superoxide dismutase
MAFELPALPYAKDALAPHMSVQTLTLHHDKHHLAYVTALNKLIENTELANESLEAIIHATAKDESKADIFNNAGQVWNHTFFWHSMKPKGGGKPSGEVARLIDRSFGSYEKFCAAFGEAAAKQFGSGWVWLVFNHGKLAVMKTPNADNPIALEQTALIGCDVWEHSYYLDFQNRRPEFVKTFLDHLVDWDFAAQNLTKVTELALG